MSGNSEKTKIIADNCPFCDFKENGEDSDAFLHAYALLGKHNIFGYFNGRLAYLEIPNRGGLQISTRHIELPIEFIIDNLRVIQCQTCAHEFDRDSELVITVIQLLRNRNFVYSNL